jgi:hypothetical protein
MNFSFQIIFIDQDAEGEECSNCKVEIEGTKWTMMLDFGDPVNFPPYPFLFIFCTECKEEILLSDDY